MLRSAPSAERFDPLSNFSPAARPSDDFGPAQQAGDPIENLTKLRHLLIQKRRFLAQDAMTYPSVYLGRAQDIAEMQKLIAAVSEAIEQERQRFGVIPAAEDSNPVR